MDYTKIIKDKSEKKTNIQSLKKRDDELGVLSTSLDDMTHDLTRDSDLLKPRAGAGHGAKAITPHDMPPLASSSCDTGHRADACAAAGRKQPMEESLKDGLGGECLEIFARELRDGWTAVGDECILFQHLVHMQPVLRPRENCVSKSHA